MIIAVLNVELTNVLMLPETDFLASFVGPNMSTSPNLFIFINMADRMEKKTALLMLWLKRQRHILKKCVAHS